MSTTITVTTLSGAIHTLRRADHCPGQPVTVRRTNGIWTNAHQGFRFAEIAGTMRLIIPDYLDQSTPVTAVTIDGVTTGIPVDEESGSAWLGRYDTVPA